MKKTSEKLWKPVLFTAIGIYFLVAIVAALLSPHGLQGMVQSIMSSIVGLIITAVIAIILSFVICLIFYKPLKDKSRRLLVFAICFLLAEITLLIAGIFVAQSMIKIAKERQGLQEQQQLEEYNRIQFNGN